MKTYRGYLIFPNPKSPTLFTVATEGRGGKIPKVLEGSFTSYGAITELINKYLDEKDVVNERKANSKA